PRKGIHAHTARNVQAPRRRAGANPHLARAPHAHTLNKAGAVARFQQQVPRPVGHVGDYARNARNIRTNAARPHRREGDAVAVATGGPVRVFQADLRDDPRRGVAPDVHTVGRRADATHTHVAVARYVETSLAPHHLVGGAGRNRLPEIDVARGAVVLNAHTP